MRRVEARRCDHFGQLFHRWRLDVDNVKRLVVDPKIPEVDPEVVGRNKRLVVRVDRD